MCLPTPDLRSPPVPMQWHPMGRRGCVRPEEWMYPSVRCRFRHSPRRMPVLLPLRPVRDWTVPNGSPGRVARPGPRVIRRRKRRPVFSGATRSESRSHVRLTADKVQVGSQKRRRDLENTEAVSPFPISRQEPVGTASVSSPTGRHSRSDNRHPAAHAESIEDRRAHLGGPPSRRRIGRDPGAIGFHRPAPRSRRERDRSASHRTRS